MSTLSFNEYFSITDIEENGCQFIQTGRSIASIEQVERIMRACATHLEKLTQEQIDYSNTENAKFLHVECERDNLQSKAASTYRKPRMGFVYLMRNQRNGFIKIGFSRDPKYREATLQSEEPEVELLTKFVGDMSDEESLHERFSAKRLRGEWFKLTDEDILSINDEMSKTM